MTESVDLKLSLAADNKAVRIELEDTQGQPLTQVILGTYDLDTVIRNLGEARAQLEPPHPRALDPKPVFRNVTRKTVFHVDREHAVSKEIFLAVLHPGFGWLAFPMAPDIAVQLGAQLARQALEAGGKAPLIGINGKPIL